MTLKWCRLDVVTTSRR